MLIELSYKKAPVKWGKKALFSYSEQAITIHVERDNQLQQIQKAARKIATNSLPAVELSGDNWLLEQCWSFYQGFYSAKNKLELQFPELKKTQQAELDIRIKCSNFMRSIINQPASDLSPLQLAERAAKFIQQQAPNKNMVNYKIISGQELQKQGYHGMWVVGKGASNPPAMLQLDFNPSLKPDSPTFACLVGKGITFDTGGYSLKPTNSMETMRADMGGAALLTATLGLAVANKLNKRVRLYLCCADNAVSSNAFRLGDIIYYSNGVTVEVLNTDAEGRLVLADGLIEAEKQKPELIIDCATLTGAAKSAVGNDYHAVLSMDDELVKELFVAADNTQELFWRLPFAELHRHQINSNFAKICNTASAPVSAGASTATAFLSYFLKNYTTNWLHIDCAATFRKSASDLWAPGATGIGMCTLAEFLLKQAK